jgi:hypothetical protein
MNDNDTDNLEIKKISKEYKYLKNSIFVDSDNIYIDPEEQKEKFNNTNNSIENIHKQFVDFDNTIIQSNDCINIDFVIEDNYVDVINKNNNYVLEKVITSEITKFDSYGLTNVHYLACNSNSFDDSINNSFKESIDDSINGSIVNSINNTFKDTFKDSLEDTIDCSIVESADKSIDNYINESFKESIEGSVEDSIDGSGSIDGSINSSIGGSIDGSINSSIDCSGSIDGSIDGSINSSGSIDGSINGSIDGSIDGSIEGSGSINGSIDGSIERPNNESFISSNSEIIKECDNNSINSSGIFEESNNDSINNSIYETLKDSDIESFDGLFNNDTDVILLNPVYFSSFNTNGVIDEGNKPNILHNNQVNAYDMCDISKSHVSPNNVSENEFLPLHNNICTANYNIDRINMEQLNRDRRNDTNKIGIITVSAMSLIGSAWITQFLV